MTFAKMNSKELLEQRNALKIEVDNIINLANSEVRELTENEAKRYNEITEKIKEINNEIRNLNVALTIENNINNKTQKMEKNFSLVKAIRNVASNKMQDELTQEVINAGIEEMRKTGNSFNGQIQLPTEVRTVTKSVEGVDVVQTDIFNVTEAIHNKSVLSALGANIVTGLVNDVQIPVISTVNCTWEGETATTADSTPTFSSVKLSPKRLSCVVPISKMLLSQDSTGVENAIRNEISKAILGKLEATIFGSAQGTTTQPQGIFYTSSSLTQVTNFADICALEAALDGTDGYGEMKYAMGVNAKAALRGMIKGTNGTGMVFENNEVDGTPAFATQFVSGNNIAYGDWSNLVVGIWSGMDIVVDNFTLAADGQIRLVVNFYADAQLARPNAIAVATI